jgi:hypothetical protein
MGKEIVYTEESKFHGQLNFKILLFQHFSMVEFNTKNNAVTMEACVTLYMHIGSFRGTHFPNCWKHLMTTHSLLLP